MPTLAEELDPRQPLKQLAEVIPGSAQAGAPGLRQMKVFVGRLRRELERKLPPRVVQEQQPHWALGKCGKVPGAAPIGCFWFIHLVSIAPLPGFYYNL